jgi:hypothetical protein
VEDRTVKFQIDPRQLALLLFYGGTLVNGKPIVATIEEGATATLSEAEAQARMMLAAPDIISCLEDLNGILGRLRTDSNYLDGRDCEMLCNKIDTVIAKAKGETA